MIHINWVLRIITSFFCGCLIGYERTSRQKNAGIRTHVLVAVGSSLIMLVSQYGFSTVLLANKRLEVDISRVAAQIVSGIGFIGAGTIIVRGKTEINGITTAASIWVTAAVGMALGAGMYDLSILVTLIAVFVQRFLRNDRLLKLFLKHIHVFFDCTFKTDEMPIGHLLTILTGLGVSKADYKIISINEARTTISIDGVILKGTENIVLHNLQRQSGILDVRAN